MPSQHPPEHLLYLVRHGRTQLNAAGRLRGRADPPLDAVGVAEAQALAAVLATRNPQRVFSSPLKRARQTADSIATAAGAPLFIDDRFIDRDYGPWTGKLQAEVLAQWGTLEDAPGVESVSAVLARARTAIDAVVGSTCEPSAVVVVTHDAVIRALISSLDPAMGQLTQPTGCWNQLQRSNGLWAVQAVDRKPLHRG